MNDLFRICDFEALSNSFQKPPVDQQTLNGAAEIVGAVRDQGEPAIRQYAEKFGERQSNEPLMIEAEELQAAFEQIPKSDQELLTRVVDRIAAFSMAQRKCLTNLSHPVEGGLAGHTIIPMQRVGCYAPGGRYPLPSTVLMTTITARTAGCESVVLASPNPTVMTMAAAHVGGAEQLLPIGGAHAIAAMAYGFDSFERVDLIAGPGNRWVTAAKKLVVGDVGIDMLAGPSELVVVADANSNSEKVACDLLAQAEHDPDASPFLVAIGREIAEKIVDSLAVLLPSLSTAEVARQALRNGAAIVVDTRENAAEVCNQLAPEHLELHLDGAESFAEKIQHAGCLFLGSQSAEVFGDYGVGPNHTLPTGRTARWSAGLNVFTFLRVRTWLKLDKPTEQLIDDTARLAGHEGLAGHAQAANIRKKQD